MKEKEYVTVSAKTCRWGQTKSTGRPYLSIGCPIEGKINSKGKPAWANYFKVVTEKTQPYLKRDLLMMGVSACSEDNFVSDGRAFRVSIEPNKYDSYDITGVYELKAKPNKSVKQLAISADEESDDPNDAPF